MIMDQIKSIMDQIKSMLNCKQFHVKGVGVQVDIKDEMVKFYCKYSKLFQIFYKIYLYRFSKNFISKLLLIDNLVLNLFIFICGLFLIFNLIKIF
jgi:hypothetical protein